MAQRRTQGSARRAGEVDDVSTAKVAIPALPGWVIPRPRLTGWIGRGCRGPLTVVTGPPGAGKTVAVASWAASRQGAAGPQGSQRAAAEDIAWVGVDDGDADPDVFWGYLVEALRGAGVALPAAARSPLRADGIDHVGVAAVAAALRRRERPVVLVLDDFRPAVRSALVSGMAYLLKLSRPLLRLVITSRRDLPLPLHRYRLTGDLTEIRAEDLAFTEREADQLIAQHGVQLRRDSLRALRGMTEGWAAGLRLAAMSMDGHPDPDGFVAQATGGDHAMAGYLVEEVLDAQQPAMRRLLLATSVLDRVNAEVATSLTEDLSGGEFSELVAQNAFIRPLGAGWYRYHQMFRDVLRLRLRHENPGRVTALHRRAAAWFDAQGLLTEAVQHAAAAQDWDLACELVVERLAVGDLLGLRPAQPLVAALADMPDAARRAGARPALVAAALALGGGDDSGCREALARADAALRERPDAAAARLTAAMVRLAHARARDGAGVGAAAAEVQRWTDEVGHDLLAGRPEVRSAALAGRAEAELWAGHWQRAGESLAAASAAAEEAGSSALRLDCLAHGALLEALRGRWARAGELAAQASRSGPDPLVSPAAPGHAVLAVARAAVALERYQLAEARREIDQAGSQPPTRSHPTLAVLRALVAARIELADGHEERAARALRRVGAARGTPPWLARRVMLAEAQLHATAGAAGAAWQAATRAGGAHASDAAVALARLQLGAGRPAAASRTVRPALTEAVAVRGEVRSDVRVEAWLLDAQACYAVGNPSGGRRSLDRALRLGDREQLRLPFVTSSPWLRSVLRSDPELARRYARLLAPLRIGPEPAPERGGHAERGPLLSRQLSERELEVLRHLAQMRTSEEIAAEMYVSINTVKTHLKSIYRKLAVTRRGDAVRRAQQLELLVSTHVPQQRSARTSEQPALPRPADRLGAGRDAELAVDEAGVALDRVHGDE